MIQVQLFYALLVNQLQKKYVDHYLIVCLLNIYMNKGSGKNSQLHHQ